MLTWLPFEVVGLWVICSLSVAFLENLVIGHSEQVLFPRLASYKMGEAKK